MFKFSEFLFKKVDHRLSPITSRPEKREREANLPEKEFDVRRDVLVVTSLADCTVQSSPVSGELSSSSQSAEQCEEVRRRGETRLGLDPRAVPGDR